MKMLQTSEQTTTCQSCGALTHEVKSDNAVEAQRPEKPTIHVPQADVIARALARLAEHNKR